MAATIEIGRAQLALIERAVRAASPTEYCAMLLGNVARQSARAVVTDVVRLRNCDARPGRFAVDDAELGQACAVARERSAEPVALLHSHPGADTTPSTCDREAMAMATLLWVIVAPVADGGLDVACFAPVTGAAMVVALPDEPR